MVLIKKTETNPKFQFQLGDDSLGYFDCLCILCGIKDTWNLRINQCHGCKWIANRLMWSHIKISGIQYFGDLLLKMDTGRMAKLSFLRMLLEDYFSISATIVGRVYLKLISGNSIENSASMRGISSWLSECVIALVKSEVQIEGDSACHCFSILENLYSGSIDDLKYAEQLIQQVFIDFSEKLEEIFCTNLLDRLVPDMGSANLRNESMVDSLKRLSLLEAIIGRHKESTIISVLRTETVRDAMKHSSYWTNFQQKALEIACAVNSDVELIKEFATSEDYVDRLDGSKPFLDAMKFSNRESAKVLIQDTKINPNFELRIG